MGYTTFTNGTQPALSDTILNNMQVELMKLVFPIGSTYITQDLTNPSEILKFGTWERLKGKVCLGVDEDDTELNTIGNTGGEKKHTMTVSELVNHKHHLSDEGIWSFGMNDSMLGNGSSGNWAYKMDGDTASTGGGQPFNIMQPYEVVGYMWIRRA